MAPKKSTREATNLTNSAFKTSARDSIDVHQTPYKIALGIWQNYLELTPPRTKIVDVFMAFLFVVGVFQFIYCNIAGNYVRVTMLCIFTGKKRLLIVLNSPLMLSCLDFLLQLGSSCLPVSLSQRARYNYITLSNVHHSYSENSNK